MGSVAKLSGKTVGGQQWIRVRGANLKPQYAEREVVNKSTFTQPVFVKACEDAGIKPTKRQASKWNNKKGVAYNLAHSIEMNGFVAPSV